MKQFGGFYKGRKYRSLLEIANQRYGFFHEHNSYRDRITGEGDGDRHLNLPTWEEIELLWNQASNKAQWMKP